MTSNLLRMLNSGNNELAQMPDHYALIIGELARIVDLEPKTIRFYEKIGLLKPMRQGRFRIFRKTDAEHLVLIKLLRKFGLSTSTIKNILAVESRPVEGNDRAGAEQILRDQLAIMRTQHDELAEHIVLLSRLLDSNVSSALNPPARAEKSTEHLVASA